MAGPEFNIEQRIDAYITDKGLKNIERSTVALQMFNEGLLTEKEYKEFESKSVFGFGFGSNSGYELGLGSVDNYSKAAELSWIDFLFSPKLKEHNEVVQFLQLMVSQANQAITERQTQAGDMSKFTNFLYEITNNELAKSEVKKEVKNFQNKLKY